MSAANTQVNILNTYTLHEFLVPFINNNDERYDNMTTPGKSYSDSIHVYNVTTSKDPYSK